MLVRAVLPPRDFRDLGYWDNRKVKHIMKTNKSPLQTAWLCVIATVLLPVAAHGQYTYVTNGSAVTISAYTGAGGAVTIPDNSDGLPITDIGAGSFSGSAVTSIVMGSNITVIETQAFRFCASLTALTLGTNVSRLKEARSKTAPSFSRSSFPTASRTLMTRHFTMTIARPTLSLAAT